ncbi:MAG: hypothetical protein LBK07_08305, partial [Tannerella sp.]|nr:hypothetical protein [Tannerella sp.]
MIKLASMWVMLASVLTAAAQEEFFDDVYFSSGKKSKTVEKKNAVTKDTEATARSLTSTGFTSAGSTSDVIDVDAYNRRYADTAEEDMIDEWDEAEEVELYAEDDEPKKKMRSSDTEYSERIIRYHSPSKITIAGADNVDLYLSDGYYAYGYETDYSDGQTTVNVNIDMNHGWGGWYGGYDPWYYNSWYYRPYG